MAFSLHLNLVYKYLLKVHWTKKVYSKHIHLFSVDWWLQCSENYINVPSYAAQNIIHWDCYTNQNFHISRLHDFLEIQLCLTLHQNFPPPPDRVVTQYPCHWRLCHAACVRQACKSCSWSPRPPLCLLASVQYRRDDTTVHTCHTAPNEPDNRQSVLTHQNTMESLLFGVLPVCQWVSCT